MLGRSGNFSSNGNLPLVKNMLSTENIRWIFSNAVLSNWLGYADGILGTVLIVMFGIGTADEAGLLSAVIRKLGLNVSDKFLPYVLVFLGILSNIATDAGYIILIPLAGLLYGGIGKNPLIGMAAAFAGVSAGFSANVIPATVVDVIIGTNAEGFSQNQGIPFVSYLGKEINPATMNYYFMLVSAFLLVILGGLITEKITKPALLKRKFVISDDLNASDFIINENEKRGLRFSAAGFVLSAFISLLLALFPLKSYVNYSTGKTVTPFLDNIILIITFIFFVCGVFYGIGAKKFKNSKDIISAMSTQVGSMGYVIVLTFFCYNFLSMLTYSGMGSYITYSGAKILLALGLNNSPYLLLLGFIVLTAVINLFVGGLSAKWMLLGPIFLPMLYHVNQTITPDVIAAAYRLADSSTNVITPLMTYSGVILMYMRKYEHSLSVSNLIKIMLPYSLIFLVFWTLLLFLFIILKIPLGF